MPPTHAAYDTLRAWGELGPESPRRPGRVLFLPRQAQTKRIIAG